MLPAYQVLDIGATYDIGEHLTVGLNGVNVLDNVGALFFQNTQEQLAPEPDVVTEEFALNNPETIFYLRSQLPRFISARVKYKF